MIRNKLRQLVPPGLNLGTERVIFRLCWAMALLYSTGFLSAYMHARDSLFVRVAVKGRVLIEGAVIQPFGELLGTSLRGFLIAALVMLALVLRHYDYYRRGSMSIYLMRRLPDGGLLHRQCWTWPVIWAALCALTALVVLGVYILIYFWATPAECLPMTAGR